MIEPTYPLHLHFCAFSSLPPPRPNPTSLTFSLNREHVQACPHLRTFFCPECLYPAFHLSVLSSFREQLKCHLFRVFLIITALFHTNFIFRLVNTTWEILSFPRLFTRLSFVSPFPM